MNKKHVWALAAITVLTLTACGKGSSAKPEGGADKAAAGGASPAIVFDKGGKFDKSFNESAYNGAEAFKKETGKNYIDIQLNDEAEREAVLRKLAQRNADPIVTVGFSGSPSVKKVAPELPNSHFVIVDDVIEGPNVKSITFREEEGSFLVGALAAMKSQTGSVGFVGGMDIPVIRRFSCGYQQGAKYVNPNVKFIENIVGTTGEAWNNPTKGGELARSQFDRGVDVIFAAAGATGNGVYQAAKDSKKYAIGVDSNQNYPFPGTMLTSMVKRVDVAVKNAFLEASQGKFKAGAQSIGLAEDGVGWADDEHNKDLITADMRTKVDQIKKDIIAGKIKVEANCKK